MFDDEVGNEFFFSNNGEAMYVAGIEWRLRPLVTTGKSSLSFKCVLLVVLCLKLLVFSISNIVFSSTKSCLLFAADTFEQLNILNGESYKSGRDEDDVPPVVVVAAVIEETACLASTVDVEDDVDDGDLDLSVICW